jgi:hypothetical protein
MKKIRGELTGIFKVFLEPDLTGGAARQRRPTIWAERQLSPTSMPSRKPRSTIQCRMTQELDSKRY